MIRILGTVFAGLLGLAFGSFLNVCLSRWPQGESIVRPRSHCRSCNRTLAWWENVPLLSWLALRGRCRTCRFWIGWRYPLVEAAMGLLWTVVAWRYLSTDPFHLAPIAFVARDLFFLGQIAFYWLLIALAVLDAEHLWLPDWLTWPGIFVGFIYKLLIGVLTIFTFTSSGGIKLLIVLAKNQLLGILAAAGLILIIRWVYWLIRHREGIGLGDAKLMAMLAAWLGLSGALLAFGLGVALGAAVAVVLLAVSSSRKSGESWAHRKLPLGTFLCLGGIVSGLWGQSIIAAYLHWSGF
jgi:leader peptidase (prepilin peptidase)/N-methyltransferase